MSGLGRKGYAAIIGAAVLIGALVTPLKAEGAQERYAEVTAYCIHGWTASGAWTRNGHVAAARSVPFGTRLYLEGVGVVMVADRGGAIYGNRLDIWMPSCWQAIQWGRRWVRTWEVYE